MKKRVISALVCVACAVNLFACANDAESTNEANMVTDTEEADEEQAGETTEEEEAESDGIAEGVNMVVNGDFEDGTTNWSTYLSQGGIATLSAQDGKGVMDIDSTGSLDYSVQLYYDGFELMMGGVYEFSFDIDTDLARNMEARLQINGGDYHGYIDNYFDIEPGETHVSWTFTMEEGTDPAPRLCLNMGTPNGEAPLEKHTITLDNVCVMLIDGSGIVVEEAEDLSNDINVNQVGFMTEARKTAVVRAAGTCDTFEIIDDAGESVYTGSLKGPVEATYAEEEVYVADFSDFETEGTYTVRVEGVGESYPFEIGDDVYDELLKTTFNMLYTQRCGMATEGEFAHGECHMEEALVYGSEDTYVDVTGGWHDAGDYGRYVVSGVQTVEDLLLAYEDYPEIWESDDMGIPESGNGIPDILDEAKYELDWLLKMQDESGGVYHKVTCKEFPGFVMPEEETDQLYLSPISTTATADFAAIMAKSSVVYADIDPDFASAALEAAKKAWDYLLVHDSSISFTNPSDILTGEYPDGQDKDERYWASVELASATMDASYLEYAESILEKYVLHGYGWDNMGTFGNIAYMAMDPSLQKDEYVSRIKTEVAAKADKYLANSDSDGYMVSLGDGYCWGSNLSVCNNARQMMFADKINGTDTYETAAYDQLSYILGQNSLSYCFVTGFGSVSAKNPHHRVSIVNQKAVPGMVIGGPDSALEDPYAKSTLADAAPAKCYADNNQSYSTNEVTIYWNTPFVYLLTSQMAKNQ